MKTHARTSAVVLAGLAVLLTSLAQLPVSGQAAPAGAQGAIPRTADGKPDFNGFYNRPGPASRPGGATVFDRTKFPPFKPGGEALFYEPRTGDPRHDEPRAFCMPSGFPSAFLAPYPVQIVQSKDWMTMVHEFMRATRLIPLDGRQHRTNADPTYYGDPVGHWEGDTLVIVTKNFKRWSLDDWYYQNPKEYRMHSEDVVFTERISWMNPTTLSYQFTVDDPKIFTAPFTEDWVMFTRPEFAKEGLYEFVCEENNRCEGGICPK